ncbi:MAG: metallophosphoesterase, partial [Ferruginibacter sp.]
MRSTPGIIIFVVVMLLLDFYIFQAFKTISSDSRYRGPLFIIFWSISLICIVAFLFFALSGPDYLNKKVRSYLFAIVIGLFMAKLVAVVFFIIDDLRRLIQLISSKLFFRNTEVETMEAEGISRSVFLSWLGMIAGGSLFGTLLYGFSNKYNYKIIRKKISFDNLPSGFKGMKIVHISDIHSGSLLNVQAVEKGVNKIMDQKPDLILFTGDLVNDKATEMKPLMNVFNKLSAPMGVYSVLGNHYYGDYVQWPIDGVSKAQNLENLKYLQKELGWKLLMNEHVVFERGDDKIALLGIENWSAKINFPKHGRLDLAHKGTEHIPFKILMSHDPSHWDAEIRPLYPDIDLTLAGHTHGMQFGVELPGIKWSPVQYVYKEWADLYEETKQKIYV